MTTTVFIAWRGGSAERGKWSPVARLQFLDGEYSFVYTQGARTLPGFHPFPGMPDLDEVYRSRELFPLLTSRLMSRSRPEYEAWLTWSGFDPARPPEPLTLLGVTEGIRQTDAVEVFAQPIPDPAGRYQARFFVHGLRHAAPTAHEWMQDLTPGDQLLLAPEDDNPHDEQAVAVMASGVHALRLGYVPRYLARDVRALLHKESLSALDLRVARINRRAPLQMRLLCTLTAPWPRGFQPCTGAEFQPIVQDRDVLQAVAGA